MSTFHADFKYQTPISVDITGTGTWGTPETNTEVRLTVPPDWDGFWNGIRSDALDVVITDAEGKNKIDFKRNSFTYDDRALILDAEWAAPSGEAHNLLWMHWGAADYATDEHNAGLAVTGPTTAQLLLERPRRVIPYDPAKIALAGTKNPDDVRLMYFGYPLLGRQSPYRSSFAYEFISYARFSVKQVGGVVVPAMAEDDLFGFGPLGVVRVGIQAGTDGSTYTVRSDVVTTLGQTLQARARLDVAELT